MRYTIEKENKVKELAAEGKSLDYIAAKTSLPKKVIWGWCPELRPHDDIIKQSVKQRYHFIFPDFEAKISTAFSPFVTEDISDDDWEMLNDVIYNTMFDLAVYVFRNAITDLPDFSDVSRLCNDPFLEYCKNFWNYETSEYIKETNKKEIIISKEYADSCYNVLHYWSPLRNKKLKDITKGDLQIMQEKLVKKDLSPSRIYFILRAGIAPLRYAYNKGLTLTNVNEFNMPKKIKKENNFIPRELVEQLFKNEWDNKLAYFANILAYYGHLKLNELKAINVSTIINNNTSKIDFNSEPCINITLILNNNNEIELNNHSRSFYLPKSIYQDLLHFIVDNNYSYEDFIFIDGKKRNTWNDELKKQAARYSDREVNFSMWSN